MIVRLTIVLLALFLSGQEADAHFGVVVPSSPMVMANTKAEQITIDIAFAHPFAAQGMPMEQPVEAFVLNISRNGNKNKTQLTLSPSTYMGEKAFKSSLVIDRPGVYQIGVAPEPYFEETEDCYIIHYAKTVIGAYGSEEGWDEPLGLPIEIVPLTRPFGNYSGNSFSGIALRHGKPMPDAVIEVEYLNNPATYKSPNAYFETQVVKTDQNGVFNFGIPWAGWWGFAALTEADYKLEQSGKPKNVELGGIIWVNFSKPESIR